MAVSRVRRRAGGGILWSNLVLASATVVFAFSVPVGAAEADGPGCQTVHVGPEVPDGTPASYFDLKAAAGEQLHLAVRAANPESYPCTVRVEAAYGQTAVNTGDTYATPDAPGSCPKTSCWVTGLPATVVVPPGERVVVPFDVHVPQGTPSGQYLAGVLAHPGTPPPKPTVSVDGTQVGAAVVARVAIGVAITVPGALQPKLAIEATRLDASGVEPVIQVVLHNVGNTWEHPNGGAVVGTGASAVRVGFRASTILPGDSATLSVPAPGVPKGRQPVHVLLQYGDALQQVEWTGELAFPQPPKVVTGPGGTTTIVVASPHTPGWVVYAVGGLGGLIVVLVIGLGWVVVAHRRRRSRRAANGERIRAAVEAALAADANVADASVADATVAGETASDADGRPES